jgi:spore maturation protein CgeB
MRNRIEAKHDIAGEPSFARPTPRELLKADRIPSLGHSDAPVRTVVDQKAGGIKAKVIQERTATPLKIVFITRLDSTSEEIGASACRRLSKSLTARGHRLLMLERGQKPKHEPPTGGQTVFYDSVKDLKDRFTREIRNADFVMLSSNVSDGAVIGDWVTHVAQGTTAFYDLNTPVTLRKLDRGESEHLSRALIQRYQLYLSFTGGPLLELIKRYYGSPLVRPLYGSVDTSVYYPEKAQLKWDLGYVGNRDGRPFCARRARILANFRLARQRQATRRFCVSERSRFL